MAKYINLEELMKFPIRRNHYDKEHGNEDFICGIETVLEYAENLPTVDAAPVVRCKDCAVPHNKYTGCPELNGLVTPPDFFCPFGEQKKGE